MCADRRTPPSYPTAAWLGQVVEDVIDPDQRIIDTHHHLWPAGAGLPYGPAELQADVDAGHRVVRTVFVECHAGYRPDGPEHLRPVGETEFVVASNASMTSPEGGPLVGAIVAHADLRLDAAAGGALDEVLDAHLVAGQGLFRGIRHYGAHDPGPDQLMGAGHTPAGLYADPAFRAGAERLGTHGFTLDIWHYHHQNREFLDLARAVPGTTIVLDHFGTPLGVGRFADRRDEVFEAWRQDIAAIAECPNVVAKLGGMAMPDNGFGWDGAARPATSEEFAEAQSRYYLHTIDCFGPERCMFESNFPIDRYSVSYRTLWNAFQRIASGFSPAERDALFFGTAARVYAVEG